MPEQETAVAPKKKKGPENGDKAETEIMELPMGEQGVQLNSLENLFRFAQCVVSSGYVPKDTKAQGVVIAIQMGLEVGLKPMQAIQNIAVINGRPSIWGDAAKALVEASGLCVEFKEYFEGEPYKDDFKAVCVLKRKGRADAIVSEFSVADAKRAGLWADKPNQTPWYKYPKRMLQMRARGFGLRDAFPDVLKGLSIAEESQDIIDVTPTEVTEAPKTIDEVTAQEAAKEASKESNDKAAGQGTKESAPSGAAMDPEHQDEARAATGKASDGDLFDEGAE